MKVPPLFKATSSANEAHIYRNMNMLAVYMLIPHEAIGCIHLQLVTEWSGLRWPALYITLLLVLEYLLSATANTLQKVTHKHSPLKGGRVMIAFFVNYSTVAFPLQLPTLKRQQFFGAVANSLGKNSYFPLPLDVRRCVAPTGEEVDARQRGVN